jgi:8-oxo-dGTP diphosphatase
MIPRMNDFFQPDELAIGSKGLVFVGAKIIVYRRTADAPTHPLELDFPGGGPEPGETPFQTFHREVKEEFGLDITEQDIVYSRRYPGIINPGKFGWFAAAKLPAEAAHQIVFGDEGIDYMLMSPAEYLARADASTFLQDRTRDYFKAVQ